MSKLKLTDVEWGEFLFPKIFSEIFIAKSSDSNALSEGDIPFVGRSSVNNGFQGLYQVSESKIVKKNCITVSMVGEPRAFYQPYDFTCSQNILVLRNEILNKDISKFLISIINNYLISKGFGYGYPVGLNRVIKNKLMLPVDSQGQPNWQFMEDYIKQEQKQQAQKIIDYYERKLVELAGDMVGLDKVEWKEFSVGELFDIKIGKNIDGNKVDRVNGGTAYITRKENTNGLDGFVNYDSEFLNSIYPVITIGNETAEPYVQDFPFFTGTKVNILLPKFKMDISILKYIATSLRQHKGKYSYSFTINSTRLKKQNILLPADKNGNPDFQYMSDFVKKLELDKVQEVLEYIYIYIYQNDDHS